MDHKFGPLKFCSDPPQRASRVYTTFGGLLLNAEPSESQDFGTREAVEVMYLTGGDDEAFHLWQWGRYANGKRFQLATEMVEKVFC